jgi:hypothetical protein
MLQLIIVTYNGLNSYIPKVDYIDNDNNWTAAKWDNEDKDKSYTASVLVFGITVHITVDFENGRRGEADAYLSEALRDFTVDRKVIDVDVEILDNLSLEATIASWVDRDWGDIPHEISIYKQYSRNLGRNEGIEQVYKPVR